VFCEFAAPSQAISGGIAHDSATRRQSPRCGTVPITSRIRAIDAIYRVASQTPRRDARPKHFDPSVSLANLLIMKRYSGYFNYMMWVHGAYSRSTDTRYVRRICCPPHQSTGRYVMKPRSSSDFKRWAYDFETYSLIYSQPKPFIKFKKQHEKINKTFIHYAYYALVTKPRTCRWTST